mgnify:CR=1 FL=1
MCINFSHKKDNTLGKMLVEHMYMQCIRMLVARVGDLKLPHFTLLIQACTNYTKIHMHSNFEDGDLSKAIGIFNILSLMVEHVSALVCSLLIYAMFG